MRQANHIRLLVLLLAPLRVLGASMNVHTMVGERALAYFAGLVPGEGLPPASAAAFDAALRAFPGAVAGGSDFPDFLYACGSYDDHHDAGEAAHWPPFQAAAVRYIRDHWPDPTKWDAEAQQVVAFTFGVAVHYVTDELWEGLTGQLSSRRGFTEQIDAFQLGNRGRGNLAEDVSNMGGDVRFSLAQPFSRLRRPILTLAVTSGACRQFYAAWALDESNVSAWQRQFPLHHLVEIYHRTPKDGHFAPNATNFTDVTLSSLFECRTLFNLGLWALKTFGALLYPLYNDGRQHQLPMVQERLLEVGWHAHASTRPKP